MSNLSQEAISFRRLVEDEASFLSTCEGGDHGTPNNRSIWLLGIEPGWSLADQAAEEEIISEREETLDNYDVETQLTWPFNRNAFKLLSALEGGAPEDYREFALRARPFERGSTGYFKANLFPEPFNKIESWDEISAAKTGFDTKDAYRAWLRENRLPVMSKWIERCKPRMVIGVGLVCLEDFLTITGNTDNPPAHYFTVNGYDKRVHVATNGIVPVAVIPHLSGGPHGLNSNEAISMAASYIRDMLLVEH